MGFFSRLFGPRPPVSTDAKPPPDTHAAPPPLPPSPIPVAVVGGAAPLWRGGLPDEVLRLSEVLEGFRAAPYKDSGGVWTIGYGSTRDGAGKPVTATTKPVTRDEAKILAARDLHRAVELTLAAFPAGLPPRWAASMILMANNLGDIHLWGRSLKWMIDAKLWGDAAYQMRLYRNSDGVPVLGLVRRRWAEAAFALGIDPAVARARAWSEIQALSDWPRLPGDPRPA